MNRIFQNPRGIYKVLILGIVSIVWAALGCSDNPTGPSQEDWDSVTAAKDSLNILFDSGEGADNVTGGEDGMIDLPDVDGVTITWKSSAPDVIDEAGRVTRPAETTALTLTAAISKNGAAETKEFALTVHPLGSRAEITEFTVTAGSQDYTADFSGTSWKILIPNFESFPAQLTVKSIALSAGAVGLKKDDLLPLTNQTASVTITAEDGTEAVYTITIAKKFTVAEVEKSTPAKDRRHHYVLFQVSSGSGSSLGRHKLALKLKTAEAPTAAEMTDGAGVYRVINGTEKRVILAYPLDSDIESITASNGGKSVKHGAAISGSSDTVDVDSHLLAPGSTYTLYALKDGEQTVEALAWLTTDVFDTAETLLDSQYFINDPAISGSYTYDADDAVFITPFIIGLKDGTYEQLYAGLAPRMRLIVKINEDFDPFQLNTDTALLFTSQTTDGQSEYYTDGSGRKIIACFLTLPMTSAKEEVFKLTNTIGNVLIGRTMSVDQ